MIVSHSISQSYSITPLTSSGHRAGQPAASRQTPDRPGGTSGFFVSSRGAYLCVAWPWLALALVFSVRPWARFEVSLSDECLNARSYHSSRRLLVCCVLGSSRGLLGGSGRFVHAVCWCLSVFGPQGLGSPGPSLSGLLELACYEPLN